MQVSDLTLEELKLFIRETVFEMLAEASSESEGFDPDVDMTLRPEFADRVRESYRRTQLGARGKPLAEVAKALGIEL